MTRHPFDQLAKQLLEQLLLPCGEVEISKEVPGEPHFIDLYFSPQANVRPNAETLGILTTMVQSPGLFEPFRNPPSVEDMESCLLKRLWLISSLRRRQTLNPNHPPLLWIIAPTISQNFLSNFGAMKKEGWVSGVYELPPALKTVMIVVHQLPTNSETLWLRLLGKGQVQQQAVEEVIALPEEDPRRAIALRLLSIWKVTIEINPEISNKEELAMPIPQAFLEWEKQVEQRGEQRGEQQGIKKVALNLIQTGMSLPQVSEVTGLSLEDLQKLLREHQE